MTRSSTWAYSPYIGSRIRACEEGLSQCRNARKMRSEEPAPGKIFTGATFRDRAMASTSPSQLVGGEVRKSQGRQSRSAERTLGEGGYQASSTSALMIVWWRDKS